MPERSPSRAALRADAERNRRALVDAARGAFRDLGAEAPYVEIARRAGIAPATLYRRFPTREDLLAEVFADRLTSCEQSIQDAARNPDPHAGLAAHIAHLTDLQAEDQAFTAVFLHSFPPDDPVAESRERAGQTLRSLLAAGKAAGRIRSDVHEREILVLLMANDGVLRSSADPQADSARLISRFLDAIRP